MSVFIKGVLAVIFVMGALFGMVYLLMSMVLGPKLAYWVEGFGATRGTMHSALEIARGGDLAFVDGALRPALGIQQERQMAGDHSFRSVRDHRREAVLPHQRMEHLKPGLAERRGDIHESSPPERAAPKQRQQKRRDAPSSSKSSDGVPSGDGRQPMGAARRAGTGPVATTLAAPRHPFVMLLPGRNPLSHHWGPHLVCPYSSGLTERVSTGDFTRRLHRSSGE